MLLSSQEVLLKKSLSQLEDRLEEIKRRWKVNCMKIIFAGEIVNIDAITGGFNFQNAWTERVYTSPY
jgi:hypothetical protein